MIKEIKDQIVACLGGVTQLQQVFGYWEPTPMAFPNAMVDIHTGGSDTTYTNENKMVGIRFFIHVTIRGNNSLDNANLRCALLDACISALHGATYVCDLNGTTDIMTIESIEPFFDDNSESPKLGFDIILKTQNLLTV